MSWLWQQEGVINQYKPEFQAGTQPVRVLHHMIVFMFQNTHSEFAKELIEQIETGNLNKQIDLQLGEEPISLGDGRNYRTPRIINVTRQIQLHETFLSYQWCITYAIYVLFLETIDYPKTNEQAGFEKYKISQENIRLAREVFDYAKSLIPFFSEWDKQELPNPEVYLAEKRDYVEQTNIFYTEGLKFILCHEYVHAKKHLTTMPANPDSSYFFEIEKEADSEAVDLILQGKNPINRWALEIGSVFGIISMFFFRESTEGTKHPNSEDRLTWVLEKLHSSDDDYCWAIACMGLQLWAEQFELYFDWSMRNKVPYRYLYYDIVRQIKERNNERA